MSEKMVYLLRVDHRHGVNSTIHATYESGKRGLLDYVKHSWEWELDNAPMPDDGDETIAKYFELVEDELYTLDQLLVQD
jgi:hypothetical protein